MNNVLSLLVRSVVVVVALLVCIGRLSAQVPDVVLAHPDLFVNIGQDDVWTCRLLHGGDTVPADDFAAAYEFGMLYDSVSPQSRTDYTFTECRRNGARLKLLHWRRNHLVHMDADVMSFNSRTANFPMVVGDSLTFTRELAWYHPITREQSLSNYYALDTLDYSVELVRASDGVVLALLDSIGIMPSLQPGPAIVHGARPIIANVGYAVPATFAGDSAFIGIRLYARGTGPYHFMRHDQQTVGYRGKVSDPWWMSYLQKFGYGSTPVVARRTVDDLAGLDGAATDGALKVELYGGGEATIRFSVPDDGAPISVMVYDAVGQLVFYPYTGPAPDREMALSYRFPKSGVYFVALAQSGRLMTTKNVTITK